jgi:hypothetical protein
VGWDPRGYDRQESQLAQLLQATADRHSQVLRELAEIPDHEATELSKSLRACRDALAMSPEALDRYFLLLQRADALAFSRTRAKRYRWAFWPALIVGVLVWTLLVASLLAGRQNAAPGIPMWNVLAFALTILVLGRLADVASTVIGMIRGARELNPSLPEHVSVGQLLPAAGRQVLMLSALAGLGGLLTMFGLPFLVVSRRPNADVEPILLAIAEHPKESTAALAGAFLAVPAIASFGAALHNLFGSGRAHQRREASMGGVILLWIVCIGLLCLTGWVVCSGENTVPLAIALLPVAALFFFTVGVGTVDLVFQGALDLGPALPSVVSALLASVPLALIWRALFLT